MNEFILKDIGNDRIHCEFECNDDAEISVLIARAMIGNPQVAKMILAAIPTFLDEAKLSREGYCITVMEACGTKNMSK